MSHIRDITALHMAYLVSASVKPIWILQNLRNCIMCHSVSLMCTSCLNVQQQASVGCRYGTGDGDSKVLGVWEVDGKAWTHPGRASEPVAPTITSIFSFGSLGSCRKVHASEKAGTMWKSLIQASESAPNRPYFSYNLKSSVMERWLRGFHF